eukprot:TRINITY_DN5631_c1_g1_i1.p1 TRINITY_DN5631_c1_g1~~TRINITY_DN5631_c1_g1_i1.p1  ORF type:complete len:364 (+),score=105.61 TRINITY_DN5631_c1_g1_i1:133-1224(+)
MNDSYVINFVGLNVGGLRLRRDLVNYENLKYLFGFSDDDTLVLLNPEANEITFNSETGLYEDLISDSNVHYTVVTERDIEEEPSIGTEEEKLNFMMKIQERAILMSQRRVNFIKEHYKPLHTDLYNIDFDNFDLKNIFASELLSAIEEGSEKGIKKILDKLTETGIYILPFFTKDFCVKFLEEIDNFETSGLPVNRPNSMNNYGVIIDEIGLKPLITYIREKFISPIASLLFKERGGDTLDSHHGFVVQYKLNEDLDLGFHYDDAEVTLNVCLGRDFTDGDLFFKGHYDDPSTYNEEYTFKHKVSFACLHIGKHRHGAQPITSGERYNLIIWCRSSEYRKNTHQCECHHNHNHNHNHNNNNNN